MGQQNILALNNITKKFPGVVALDNVSIGFAEGEVHAIVGENGAGKSTLIKIMSGAHEPDNGTLEIFGKVHTKLQPKQAMDAGIQVIYQEFNLVPTLSVYENIFLGSYPQKGMTVDKSTMIKKSHELFDLMDISLDPLKQVRQLSAAHQQIVEIAKALSKQAKILIMDEPSAPLTNHEVGKMFEIIAKLKKQGVVIIYISHRLDEIFEIADRVTILRDGQYIETKNISATNKNQLISMMVGRELSETYPSREIAKNEVALEVKNLCGAANKNVSFKLHKGEILGVGGLVGSGRTELMRLIFGADPLTSGQIYMDGKLVQIKSPKQAIRIGIGLIPEDRKQHGVILEMPIDRNITLASLKNVSNHCVLSAKCETQVAEEYRERFRVKTPSIRQLVKNLSGGNQQKVILGKWIATNSKVLIFDEPTRGIDVGAKQEIYNLMSKLAEDEIGIIMVSSDMEELLGMSDRIIVFHDGGIVGEIEKEGFSQEAVLKMASGIYREESAC